MAVKLDNLDSMIKGLAKLEESVGTDVIREARKRMRATIRKYIPVFKKVSPKRSGDLIKSVKVKSRSRRGVSSVQLAWNVPYAGFANFTPDQLASGFATEKYSQSKKALEDQGIEDVKESFKMVFRQHGVKFV